MELTKDYLDQQFEKQFTRITGYIEGKLANYATKDDLKAFATKDDLNEALSIQTKQLENYTEEVAQGLLEAVDFRFSQVDRRLDTLESDMKQVKTMLHIPQNTQK